MIKIDHHDWFVVVLSNRIPNFIINYKRIVYKLQGYELNLLYDNLITQTVKPKSYSLIIAYGPFLYIYDK